MKHFTRFYVNDLEITRNEQLSAGPRTETLEFIRQFARVYRYESALDEQLGSYILN